MLFGGGKKRNVEQMLEKVKHSMSVLKWDGTVNSPSYHKYSLNQMAIAERAFAAGNYDLAGVILQKIAATCYYEGAAELDNHKVTERGIWGIR